MTADALPLLILALLLGAVAGGLAAFGLARRRAAHAVALARAERFFQISSSQ